MTKRRTKTLYYLRARYFADDRAGLSLEQSTREASTSLETAKQRTFDRGGGQYVRLAHVRPRENGVLIHLTVDTPGENACVVPVVNEVINEITVTTALPPAESEYMDGDAFALIVGDDVCLCTSVIRSGAVSYFLQKFLTAGCVHPNAADFDLLNAANIRSIEKINQVGVKSIDLRASLYSASMTYLERQTQTFGVIGSIRKTLAAALGPNERLPDEALLVDVSFHVDRKRDEAESGNRRIRQMARNLIEHKEDNDEYEIKLQDGTIIKPDKMTVKEVTGIESFGKSVQRDEAWEALERFYERISLSGEITQ